MIEPLDVEIKVVVRDPKRIARGDAVIGRNFTLSRAVWDNRDDGYVRNWWAVLPEDARAMFLWVAKVIADTGTLDGLT